MSTFLFIPTIRAPFTKAQPGLGLDLKSKYSRKLVLSYPVNEGNGTFLKNYGVVKGSGIGSYDLRWLDNNPSPPVWGTWAKVRGLHYPLQTGSALTQAYGNTGGTNPNETGANLLPAIDYTKGITIHVWMRPTESLVGVVTSYAFLFLGEDAVARGIVMMGLSRGPDGVGGDCWKPNVNIYSNGSASTNLGGSFSARTPWDAPFTGGRVKIDSLPYEHILTVIPNGDVHWYASDGYQASLGTLGTGITPPDGFQYWPQIGVDDGLGLDRFEGDFWGLNIWNYAMAQDAAFTVMRNPQQMYKARSSGGGYVAMVPPAQPPYPVPGPYPPGTPPPEDDSDTEAKSYACFDVV